MRQVLIAIAVVIVLVWLIPHDPRLDSPVQAPPTVAPVAETPESSSTADAPLHSDEPVARDPADPPVRLPDQVAATPMEQKARSARALISPGMAGIEQAFNAEPVDPLWAAGMERNILDQIAQANLQLVTMQVECRTSMCRVQLVEPPSKSLDMAAFKDLVRGFGLDVWRMLGSRNPNGATTTAAYLARPGDCYHGRERSVCREPTP